MDGDATLPPTPHVPLSLPNRKKTLYIWSSEPSSWSKVCRTFTTQPFHFLPAFDVCLCPWHSTIQNPIYASDNETNQHPTMTAPKVVVADPAKRQDIRVITAPMPYPVSYPNSIFEGPTPHASTPTSPILRPTQGHLSSSSSSSTLVNLAQLQITKDQDKKEPEIFSREPGSPDSSFGRGDDPEKRGSSPPPPTEPPYHVFSRGRKRQMVYIVSLAALFSPLSSNIYFPALGDVSQVSGSIVSW